MTTVALLTRESTVLAQEQRLIDMFDPSRHPRGGHLIDHLGARWLVTATARAGSSVAVWGVPVSAEGVW